MKSTRRPTIHEKEILLNKDNLKKILDSKDLEYIELHKRIVDKYGLDLTYKGFMSLLSNRSTWKLLYAWAIIDVLIINMTDIFDIVDIDVAKKTKEKKLWKEKYQNKTK